MATDGLPANGSGSSGSTGSITACNLQQLQPQLQPQQLRFTDYDDLQTRLVLLPRDEEEEGIGAVVSMYYYYYYDDDHKSDRANDGDPSTACLRLDESVTGYVLHHISSTGTGRDPEQEVMPQSSSLIDDDFASILSILRNHPPPIVLTVVSNTGSSSSNSSCSCSREDHTTVTTDNDEDIVGNKEAITREEEEKKSEEGIAPNTACANPPPPPQMKSSVSKNIARSITTTTTKAASQTTTPPPPPQSLQSSPNWSSWTSRMSAVVAVKATALAKAANEQAKVTTAMVAAAVTPDFPNAAVAARSSASANATATTNASDGDTVVNTGTNSTKNHEQSDVTPRTTLSGSHGTVEDSDIQPPTPVTIAPTELPPAADKTTTSSSSTTTTSTMTPLNVLENHRPRLPLPELHIYVQSETGTFIAVPEISSSIEGPGLVAPTTKSNPSTLITNSSYIMVRNNAQQPAPVHANHRYQWYRSGLSSSNNHSNHNSNDNNSNNNIHKNNNTNTWIKLPGATGPTLQPSATEIGYRLRCTISLSNDDDADDDHDTTTDANAGASQVICETADIVTAAMPILNGSRQALARGAQFGGLLGQGKAEGRTFRIKILLSSVSASSSSSSSSQHSIDQRRSISDGGSSSHHSTTTSSRPSTIAAVTIYQVAGMTAEPIHPEHEPLFCRAATVWDYNQIKDIALVFQSNDMPQSASMVAALCSTDHEDEDDDMLALSHPRLYFRLQAPNRLARESMLLSLGIANFQGKPSELNARSILFHHHSGFHENCTGSGSASSSLGDDSMASQSSSVAWLASPTPEKITVQRPFGGVDATVAGIQTDRDEELEALRSKLSRKDKVISELQRQVTQSDDVQRQTATKLSLVQKEVDEKQNELLGLQKSLSLVNDKLERLDNEIRTIKSVNDSRCDALECDIQTHKDRIIALERENRTLQNDKDVLNAAVESRDFKLFKMDELQASLDDARVKLAQRNNFQLELDEANKRYSDSRKEVERLQVSNGEYMDERRISQERIASLEETLRAERSKFSSHQSQLEMEQMKVQKLKAERNSYKQKGDSLAKEMSRICRDGRTIREIEKLLADDATRREEVTVLREQKRKALEQVDHFRTAYEQSLSLQKLAGMDHDAGKLLERNAELERLLSELTEYLTAKEMQLDTMKQVNDTLQAEIRHLARASMSSNDI